jgi:hypothetical protein
MTDGALTLPWACLCRLGNACLKTTLSVCLRLRQTASAGLEEACQWPPCHRSVGIGQASPACPDAPCGFAPRGYRMKNRPCADFLFGFRAADQAARAADTARTLHSGWRSSYGGANAGRLSRKRETWAAFGHSSHQGSTAGVHAPDAHLSRAGQNLSRPSVAAGLSHPSSCLVNAHAKTALTEPARPRRWQQSGAWARVATPVKLHSPRHTLP